MKSLRQGSLKNNVFNSNVKFQVWVVHSKRDIHVQKIKVFEYIFLSFKEMIVCFNEVFIITKASYSV